MTKMTKRGSEDNVITYEHICDTVADLTDINPDYINLGSIAIVLAGTTGGLEVYMANSSKQWINLASGSAEG